LSDEDILVLNATINGEYDVRQVSEVIIDKFDEFKNTLGDVKNKTGLLSDLIDTLTEEDAETLLEML
jgi:hypothetical protein